MLLKVNKAALTKGEPGSRSIESRGAEQWTEEQQEAAKELLVASADVFSKDDLDLGKCNILKHDIKINRSSTIQGKVQKDTTHLYEEVKTHLQEMVEVGQSGGVSVHGLVQWC